MIVSHPSTRRIPGQRWWLRIAHDTEGGGASALRKPMPADTISTECEAFVRKHERAILNYLWRMTGEEETARDLAQEVFLRAWQHFETLRTYDKPSGWLFRVATNLALTHLKRRSLPAGSPEILTDERAPAASDPAWRLAERDLVRHILLELTPQRRAALVLREVYGMSAAEVGSILGISDVAVRMALHRARDQFRELYQREGGFDHGR